MNDLLAKVVAGSDFQKGVFLLVTGIVFVFAVQTLFYFFIKAFAGKNRT